MNWMIIISITGGAVASYLAYSYGFLTASLAFFMGGTVLAALELLRQLLLLKSRNDGFPKFFENERNSTSSQPVPEDSSLSARESVGEADSTSPDETSAVHIFRKTGASCGPEGPSQ